VGKICKELYGAAALEQQDSIEIYDDGFTLDCGGATLRPKAEDTFTAIVVAASRVTIKNCKIEGYKTGIIISPMVSDVILDNIQLKNNEVAINLNGNKNKLKKIDAVNNEFALWIAAEGECSDNTIEFIGSQRDYDEKIDINPQAKDNIITYTK